MNNSSATFLIGGGRLKTYLGGWGSGQGMTLQSDGKIIVVGWCTVTYTDYTWHWSTDFTLVRYNADGRVDGKLTTDLGGYDEAYAVRVQPDGKVVVAGGGGDGSDFTLARYNADGSFDATFSDDGKLTTDFGGYDFGYSMTLQADGKILVAGESKADFAVARYNTNGSLDTTFSVDGKLTTDFGWSDYGRSIILQSDGMVVVAGASNGDFAVARYNTNGSLDTTFSVDGKLTTDFGGNDFGNSIALQSDGKFVVAGAGNGDFAVARYNADGTLDTTFGSKGKLTTDFGGDDYGNSIILQSDGKIVVAGVSDGDFAVVRYNTNGTLDTTFSGDGKLITDFSGDDYGGSISVQADGKLTVAGGSNGDFAVARYNSDGSLDKTFGNRFTYYALTPVDKILYNFTLSSPNIGSLYDINADGFFDRMDVTDNWMDRGGFLHTYISSYQLTWNDDTHWTAHALKELVFGAAIDTLGRPVTLYIDGDEISIIWQAKNSDNVIGTISFLDGGNSEPLLIKLVDSDGNNIPDQGFVVRGSEPAIATIEPFILLGWTSFSQAAVTVMMTSSDFYGRVALDTENKPEAFVFSSFSDGEGGKLTTDFGGDENGVSMALQSDGKILVAGYRFTDRDIINNIEPNIDFVVARYNADGTLDTIFSEDGKLATDFGWDDQAYSIGVQFDKKIVVAGSSDGDFALARFNADGSLDTTFHANGQVLTDFNGNDRVYSVKIQSDGKIIVAGASDDNFALARYSADGLLDTTFSDDGMVTTDFGGNDCGKSMMVLSGGKIVVAGSSNGDFVLARYNANGTLDSTFSDDGKLTTDFGGDDYGNSMILQTDSKIVVAGSSNGDFVLARYNANGTLDTTFSDDGKLITDFGGDDIGNSVILQSDGKIIVAGSSDGNFALSRYSANGSLDTTFSDDGKLVTDLYGDDKGYCVNVQSDGKIIVAGASDKDFALTRYNSDGSPDGNFGNLTTYVPLLLPDKQEDYLKDIFVISPVYTGKLFDVDGNGILDRMDVVNTWENKDGYTETSTACYLLTWIDNTHWTAKAFELLAFDLQYDSDGRPTSLYGATINYMSTVTNGILATVSWGDDTLQFIDTNGDNLPDQASYVLLTEELVTYTFFANLIEWTYDINNQATSVTLVVQTSSDPNDVFSGSVVGSNSDPSIIVMPSFNATKPTVTAFSPGDAAIGIVVGSDIKLIFSEAIQRGIGTIEIHSGSAAGPVIESYNAATSGNLTINGNELTINPTADLARDTQYFVTFTEGSVKDLAGNSYAGTITYDFSTDSSMVGGSAESWLYLASWADLMAAFGADSSLAALHYNTHGKNEGRTLTFDAWGYLASWADLRGAFGTNLGAAAQHYVEYGRTEGRTITFDAWGYLASWADLRGAFGTDLGAATRHYVEYGANEGRTLNFDAWKYLASWDDLITAFGSDTVAATKHYVAFGANEGRTMIFDAEGYLLSYDDLHAAFGTDTHTAILHYVNYGYHEGRHLVSVDGAPVVASFSPVDGAAGVALESNIVLTFNESIHRGTGSIELHVGSSTGELVESYDMATSTHLTVSGTTLTINPTDDFARGTQYFVTLTSGSIIDLSGNSYAGTTSYDFISAPNLTGTAAGETLSGESGNETISGLGGNDTLNGGAGTDLLIGGDGNDLFVFSNASDIGISAGSRDVISDFTSGQDHIDLSGIDANTTAAGDQAFSGTILGISDVFSSAGQLRYNSAEGVLYGNTDSDAEAEFTIQLLGLITLNTADLVL